MVALITAIQDVVIRVLMGALDLAVEVVLVVLVVAPINAPGVVMNAAADVGIVAQLLVVVVKVLVILGAAPGVIGFVLPALLDAQVEPVKEAAQVLVQEIVKGLALESVLQAVEEVPPVLGV